MRKLLLYNIITLIMFEKRHNKNYKKLFSRNGPVMAILIGQCGILVGKWPMADCQIVLCYVRKTVCKLCLFRQAFTAVTAHFVSATTPINFIEGNYNYDALICTSMVSYSVWINSTHNAGMKNAMVFSSTSYY